MNMFRYKGKMHFITLVNRGYVQIILTFITPTIKRRDIRMVIEKFITMIICTEKYLIQIHIRISF